MNDNEFDIVAGIRLFNECDFFEAHDFFEDLWMDCAYEERLFFQGLVQISVGCYHFISGNLKGAFSQLLKGKNKLEKYLPVYRKIDLESLLNELNVLILEVEDNFNENKAENRADVIPKIKYMFS